MIPDGEPCLTNQLVPFIENLFLIFTKRDVFS